MREKIYGNIWDPIGEKYSSARRFYPALRVGLIAAGVFYLLLVFAYMFAMILAVLDGAEVVVPAAQAKGLLALAAVLTAAEVAGCVCTLLGARVPGAAISLAVAVLSPLLLWRGAIRGIFKALHLISLLLLLLVQTVWCVLGELERRRTRREYDKTVSAVLRAGAGGDVLLSSEEADRLLSSYRYGDEILEHPPKRSQKARRRKG